MDMAQAEKHSKLFLWDSGTNSLIKKFDGHSLTIVQIEFSYDDKYILTVSRDRSICVYEKIGEEKDFKLIQIEKEVHARIIWGCSWSSDSEIFLTGSRDKCLKIWRKNKTENLENKKLFEEVLNYEFEDAITSVNLVDVQVKGFYIGFCGLENGDIILFSIRLSDCCKIRILEKFPIFLSHGLAVKRIKSFAEKDHIKIASCSDDHTVRIFQISLEYLECLLNNEL